MSVKNFIVNLIFNYSTNFTFGLNHLNKVQNYKQRHINIIAIPYYSDQIFYFMKLHQKFKNRFSYQWEKNKIPKIL